MFRFRGDIYLAFYHGDGHRYKQHEATDKIKTYRSRDEGKTWTEIASCPPNDTKKFQGTPEFVPTEGTLFCYDFDANRQTQVRTSTDGERWSEPQPCYKAPFYFWGVMYDPQSKLFWCPPHAIPHTGTSSERQIHLLKSADGLKWEFVSLVAPFDNSSESTLRFEPDRTLTILIRRKYGTTSTVAVAQPPVHRLEAQRPARDRRRGALLRDRRADVPRLAGHVSRPGRAGARRTAPVRQAPLVLDDLPLDERPAACRMGRDGQRRRLLVSAPRRNAPAKCSAPTTASTRTGSAKPIFAATTSRRF